MAKYRARIRQPRVQAATVIILALLVGVATYSYLISYQSRVERANALTPIYVAKQEIPAGTSFAEINNESLLELRNLPIGALPVGAITPDTKIDDNLRARGPLSAGQILVANYFVTDAIPDVGLSIPKGMLAITISVDDVGRVGNFVSPGSRVVIYSTSANGAGTMQSKVLLKEALVLSVGTQTNSTNGSMPIASPLVTVALSPLDAQKLLLGSKTSELTLALAYQNDPLSVLSSIELGN